MQAQLEIHIKETCMWSAAVRSSNQVDQACVRSERLAALASDGVRARRRWRGALELTPRSPAERVQLSGRDTAVKGSLRHVNTSAVETSYAYECVRLSDYRAGDHVPHDDVVMGR